MGKILEFFGYGWVICVIYKFLTGHDLALYHGNELAAAIFVYFVLSFPGLAVGIVGTILSSYRRKRELMYLKGELDKI